MRFSSWPWCYCIIFSLRQVAEELGEKIRELYMVVDLTKAFVTVNREALWKVLRKHGIPNSMLSVTISFPRGYEGWCDVWLEGFWIDRISTGTKQACVMAPVLFAMYFSVMFNMLILVRLVVFSFNFTQVVAFLTIIVSKHEFVCVWASNVISCGRCCSGSCISWGGSRSCGSLLECF